MTHTLVAKASVTIDAPVSRVWSALVTPEAIKQYMFGTNVITTWEEGSSIVWKGEWEGKSYEDRGTILLFQPERTLRYTYLSSFSGLPDRPENYHTITVDVAPEGEQTRVTISQDNIGTEQSRDHSQKNWQFVLEGLKGYVER